MDSGRMPEVERMAAMQPSYTSIPLVDDEITEKSNKNSNFGLEGRWTVKKYIFGRQSLTPHHILTLVLGRTIIFLIAERIYLQVTLIETCVHSLSTPSPALKAVSRPYSTVYFDGAFGNHGKWRAPPSADLDALWDDISDSTPLIPVSYEDVRRLGKRPEDYLQIPPELQSKYGEGILGGVEVFHQLHCLVSPPKTSLSRFPAYSKSQNWIRKYVYMDYYAESLYRDSNSSNDALLRTHIGLAIYTDCVGVYFLLTSADHCIDMLRQNLMCTADAGILTSYWVVGRDLPMPDFYSRHQCRDFNALKSWTMENRVVGELEAESNFKEKVWDRKEYAASHQYYT
ncbi:hypothetical protein PVAG01_08718 [Phlyctema vagabunda]|uniref:Uncharacterized protein n=1 Tax=Phlyctema vagabunda TaxID=108571 RepID=A0ABR4PA83_9HELO